MVPIFGPNKLPIWIPPGQREVPKFAPSTATGARFFFRQKMDVLSWMEMDKALQEFCNMLNDVK